MELPSPSFGVRLADDPTERTKQIMEAVKSASVDLPMSQFVLMLHVVQVGLSHPQFDHAEKIAAFEAIARQWCEDAIKKNPGLKPMFDQNWEAIAAGREERYGRTAKVLPRNFDELKALASFLEVEFAYLMDEQTLRQTIAKQFKAEIVQQALKHIRSIASGATSRQSA